MYISGSVTEMRSLFKTAQEMKANAIYFLAPDAVLILSENKEDYAYIKCPMTIRRSVMIPMRNFKNMDIYMRSAVRQSKGHPYLDQIRSVTFTPDTMRFDHTGHGIWYIKNTFLKLRKNVENRTRETIGSAYDLNLPYLRLNTNSLKQLTSQMRDYKNRYLYKRKVADNALHVEDDQLVLYYKHDNEDVRIETGITDFVVNEDYLEYFFHFSDLSVASIRLLSKSTYMEEFVILPRDGYCVIEGYMTNMVAKVRTKLKNDLSQEKV